MRMADGIRLGETPARQAHSAHFCSQIQKTKDDEKWKSTFYDRKLYKSACNRIDEHIIRPHRRGGRVVEGAPLLREYTRDGIEGSNPFFSAIVSQFSCNNWRYKRTAFIAALVRKSLTSPYDISCLRSLWASRTMAFSGVLPNSKSFLPVT